MELERQLKIIARDVRRRLVRMIYEAHGGHIGGSLSSVDILVALYFGVMRFDPLQPRDPNRDRFILSKGHSVEGFYCVLGNGRILFRELLVRIWNFRHYALRSPDYESPRG